MTAWLDNARSILVLSCSKAVRKNRNWIAARTYVVWPGEPFYKDGTASCGLTLEGSDEEVRLSHDAKRGRSRSCGLGSVFRVGGPLFGFIALPLANEPIQITKDPPLLQHQE